MDDTPLVASVLWYPKDGDGDPVLYANLAQLWPGLVAYEGGRVRADFQIVVNGVTTRVSCDLYADGSARVDGSRDGVSWASVTEPASG